MERKERTVLRRKARNYRNWKRLCRFGRSREYLRPSKKSQGAFHGDLVKVYLQKK